MSHLLGLKEEIIKASQEYYNATSAEDKQKHKESLQKTFKKFHKFRYTRMGDYKFVEKLITRILQGSSPLCTEKRERSLQRK